MKKKSPGMLAVVLFLLLSSQGLFAWGSLTHAFITGRIASGDEAARHNAIYGSTAPDFANFMFSSPYQWYLMDATHIEFLRVWKMARGGPLHTMEQAVALGFVAHNEEDFVAHSSSLQLSPDAGYVIQKARELEALIGPAWEQLGLAGDQYAALRLDLSHEVIEFAGDLFVALYLDPDTGMLLSNSALTDNADFPKLLAKAYAGNLVAFSNQNGMRLNQPMAAKILETGELEFRNMMMNYGGIFTGDPGEVTGKVIAYLQAMAAIQGIEINDPALVAQILEAALYVIQEDFGPEVFQTISFTAERLAQQRISY